MTHQESRIMAPSWSPPMWLFAASRAFEIAEERRREADHERLVHSIQRSDAHDPIRHAVAHAMAGASRAFASAAQGLDGHALEERRT